jgi:hypothetical protein
VPAAIIEVRWKIVSQDATVRRAMATGNAKGDVRWRLVINDK